MRAVVQRVTEADVTAEGRLTGSIGPGLVVLLGVEEGDSEKDAEYLAEKITGLRIFEDEEGKMNRSLLDRGGKILAVSQFTLLGDARHGKRPSFSRAAAPQEANRLYRYFIDCVNSGRPFDVVPIWDSTRSIGVIEAAVKSLNTGELVRL